jgi:hypothetical protein
MWGAAGAEKNEHVRQVSRNEQRGDASSTRRSDHEADNNGHEHEEGFLEGLGLSKMSTNMLVGGFIGLVFVPLPGAMATGIALGRARDLREEQQRAEEAKLDFNSTTGAEDNPIRNRPRSKTCSVSNIRQPHIRQLKRHSITCSRPLAISPLPPRSADISSPAHRRGSFGMSSHTGRNSAACSDGRWITPGIWKSSAVKSPKAHDRKARPIASSSNSSSSSSSERNDCDGTSRNISRRSSLKVKHAAQASAARRRSVTSGPSRRGSVSSTGDSGTWELGVSVVDVAGRRVKL